MSTTHKNALSNKNENQSQIKTKFEQKKLSEISERNMQLLQNPQKIAYKKSPLINNEFGKQQQFSIGYDPQIRSPSHLLQLPGNVLNASILNQINQSSSKQFNKTQFVKPKNQNEQINEMKIQFTDNVVSGPDGQKSTQIIVDSRLNTPKKKNEFVSPLNEKLDKMKKSLHRLMFNSTVEDKLLSKDSYEDVENNSDQNQSQNLAKQLKEQIISDLQITDQQYYNYQYQNQNYNNIYSNNYQIGNQGNILKGINGPNDIQLINDLHSQFLNPQNISLGQPKNFLNHEFNVTQTGTFMNESFQRQTHLNRENLVITAPQQLQNSMENRHHMSQQPSTAFVNDNPEANLFIQNEIQQTTSVDGMTKQTSKVQSLKSKMTIDQIFESENQTQQKNNQHNMNIINQVEPFENFQNNQNVQYQQSQMINEASGDIQVNDQSNMFENNNISSQYQIIGNSVNQDLNWQNQEQHLIENNQYQDLLQKQNEINQLMSILVDSNGNAMPYDQLDFQNYLNQQDLNYQDFDDQILEQNLRSLDQRISQISPKSLKSKEILQSNVQTLQNIENRQNNFQSSHICYVQAIVSQKDKYKERLKDFDKHKCTFVNDLQKVNRASPKQKIQPEIKVNETKKENKIVAQVQRSREYISISHGDSIEQFANKSLSKLLNQKQMLSNQYNQLKTESTGLDDKFIDSRNLLISPDFNQKLNQQIQLNGVQELRFKQYLQKLKREFGSSKNSGQQSGDNLQPLRIDLVAQSNQSLIKQDQKTTSNKKINKIFQVQESSHQNIQNKKRYHNEFFQRKKYSLDNHLKSTNIFAQSNLRTLNQRLQNDDQQINENSEFNIQNKKSKLKSKINQFRSHNRQENESKNNINDEAKSNKLNTKNSVEKLQMIAATAFQNKILKSSSSEQNDDNILIGLEQKNEKHVSIRMETGNSIEKSQKNVDSKNNNQQNSQNTIQKSQLYKQYLMATPYSQTHTKGLLDSAGFNLSKSTQSKLEQILMLDDQIYQNQNKPQNIQPPVNSKETDSIQDQIQAEEVDIVRQIQSAELSEQEFQKVSQNNLNHQRKIIDFQNKSNQMNESYKNLISQNNFNINLNNDIKMMDRRVDSKLGTKQIYRPAIIGLVLPINQQENKEQIAKYNILAQLSQQINNIKADSQISFDNMSIQKNISQIQKQIQSLHPSNRNKKMDQILNDKNMNRQMRNNKLSVLPEFQIQSPLQINKMSQTQTDKKQNARKFEEHTKLPSVIIEGRGSSQVGDAVESAQLSSTQKNFNDFSSNNKTKKGKGSIADQFPPNSPVDIYKQNSFRNQSGFSFQSSTQDAMGLPIKNNISTFNQFFQNQKFKDQQILKNEYLLQQKLMQKQNINIQNSEFSQITINQIQHFLNLEDPKYNQGFNALKSPVTLQQRNNENEFNLQQQKQSPREIIELKKIEEIKERNKIIFGNELQLKQSNQRLMKKNVNQILKKSQDQKDLNKNYNIIENGGDITSKDQNDKQKKLKNQNGYYLQNNIDMQQIIELNQYQIQMSNRSISDQKHTKDLKNNYAAFEADRINKQFKPTPISHINKSAMSRQTSIKQKYQQSQKYNTLRDSTQKQSVEFPFTTKIQSNQQSPQILKMPEIKNEKYQQIQKDELQNSQDFIESNLSQAQKSTYNQKVKIVKNKLDQQFSISQNQNSEDKLDENLLDQGTLIYTQEFPEDINQQTQRTSVYAQKKKQAREKVNKDLLLKSQNQSIQSIIGIKIELQKNPKLNIGENNMNDDISNLTNRKYMQNDPRLIYNDAKKEKDQINQRSVNQSLNANKDFRKINGSVFDQNSNSTHANKRAPNQTQVSIINLSEMI